MGQVLGNYKEFEGNDFFGKSMVGFWLSQTKGYRWICCSWSWIFSWTARTAWNVFLVIQENNGWGLTHVVKGTKRQESGNSSLGQKRGPHEDFCHTMRTLQKLMGNIKTWAKMIRMIVSWVLKLEKSHKRIL